MKKRTLADYLSKTIVNNDIRYMTAELQQQVQDLTPACHGSIRERLYWLQRKLTAYPTCLHCNKSLTSASFLNGIKGYRSYCSRSCMRNSDAYQAAYAETCLAKYGTAHSFSSSEIQQKRQATNLAKYGDANPGRWGGEKYRERMLSAHGVDNPLKSESIRNRVSASLKGAYITSGKLDDRLSKIQANEAVRLLDEYQGYDHSYRWEHTCGTIFSSNLADGKIPACPRCRSSSLPQDELYEFIEGLVGKNKLSKNDRTIIGPFELDIYYAELKLAFELNGTYYHTEYFLGDDAKQYHLRKTKLCAEKGIQLIHIFEDEWIEKRKQLEKKIINLVKLSPTSGARKLTVRTVTPKERNEFLNAFHLQGADTSKHAYGLYDADRLRAVMTFCKPRFNKQHQWELSRFATDGSAIAGGASKLLAAFVREHSPSSMVTYADLRFSSGKLYHSLGFSALHESPPNFIYVKSGRKLSRYQAQKHRLLELLGSSFDPLLTEKANMNKAGWYRLYDCGNAVFERKFS